MEHQNERVCADLDIPCDAQRSTLVFPHHDLLSVVARLTFTRLGRGNLIRQSDNRFEAFVQECAV